MNLMDLSKVNPKLVWIMASVAKGGKVYVKSDLAAFVLDMFPELTDFIRVADLQNLLAVLPMLGSNDYLVLQEQDLRDLSKSDLHSENLIDGLLWISRRSGCQVVLWGDKTYPKELVDFSIQESDWRSILLEFQKQGKNLIKDYLQSLALDCPRKALFLDRDGVVVEDTAYLASPSSVQLRAGVAHLFHQAKLHNYLVILVTNQSGVGRGMFSVQDYQSVHSQMVKLLAEQNCFLDDVYVSYFIEDAKSVQGLSGMSSRKPRPGNLHAARKKWNIDLSHSAFIGDRATDMMCAALAGVPKLFMTQNSWTHSEQDKLSHWGLWGHLDPKPELKLLNDYSDLELS